MAEPSTETMTREYTKIKAYKWTSGLLLTDIDCTVSHINGQLTQQLCILEPKVTHGHSGLIHPIGGPQARERLRGPLGF